MRLGIIRPETKGLLQAGDRLPQLALVPEDKPQVVVRLGIVRLETKGLLQTGDRLPQLALLVEDNPQVADALGKVRLQANGLANALAGQIVSAHLFGKQPQQMQRIDMLRVHLKDLPVQTLRLLGAPPPGGAAWPAPTPPQCLPCLSSRPFTINGPIG